MGARTGLATLELARLSKKTRLLQGRIFVLLCSVCRVATSNISTPKTPRLHRIPDNSSSHCCTIIVVHRSGESCTSRVIPHFQPCLMALLYSRPVVYRYLCYFLLQSFT